MSFTCTSQGTMQPISYHIYKSVPTALPPNKFKPGDPVFYWDTTVASTDTTTTALTRLDFAQKMEDHREAIKKQANNKNTASSDVLHWH